MGSGLTPKYGRSLGFHRKLGPPRHQNLFWLLVKVAPLASCAYIPPSSALSAQKERLSHFHPPAVPGTVSAAAGAHAPRVGRVGQRSVSLSSPVALSQKDDSWGCIIFFMDYLFPLSETQLVSGDQRVALTAQFQGRHPPKEPEGLLRAGVSVVAHCVPCRFP